MVMSAMMGTIYMRVTKMGHKGHSGRKEQTNRPQKAKCSCSHEKGKYSRQEYMILERYFMTTCLRAKRITVKSLNSYSYKAKKVPTT